MVSASGWLLPTLSQVTQRFVELGEERFEASYVASQYAHYLPQTYRREEIYEILGDMVTAVVNLKRNHNLVAKDDPVDWLNRHGSDWKADFPLPVDDDVGNAILADMVRTAVSSEFDTDVAVFEGKRFLSGVSTGQPRLNFQFVAQPFYTLNSLFTESLTQAIPHRLHIELFNTVGKTWHFADAYRIQWKKPTCTKVQ